MRRLAFILTASLVTACGSGDPLLESAQARVRDEMRDPGSAEFRNLIHRRNFICGEVNGKNGFGGYAGFQRFSYDEASERVRFGKLIDENCWTEAEKAERVALRKAVRDLDQKMCARSQSDELKRECLKLLERDRTE